MTSQAENLRAWAQGTYADEAAVELLCRAFGGHFADDVYPWVKRVDSGAYLDAHAINETTAGALSGGEQRVLSVVAALCRDGAPVNLREALGSLDQENAALITAAVAHATGGHEIGNRILEWPPTVT